MSMLTYYSMSRKRKWLQGRFILDSCSRMKIKDLCYCCCFFLSFLSLLCHLYGCPHLQSTRMIAEASLNCDTQTTQHPLEKGLDSCGGYLQIGKHFSEATRRLLFTRHWLYLGHIVFLKLIMSKETITPGVTNSTMILRVSDAYLGKWVTWHRGAQRTKSDSIRNEGAGTGCWVDSQPWLL